MEAITDRVLAQLKFFIDRQRRILAFRLVHIGSFSVAGSEEGNRNYAPMAVGAVPFHDPVTH
jgi:hypothetical protein